MAEIQVRHANTTTETRDADGRVTETAKTFNLGHWEMWKIQQGLELLPTSPDTDDDEKAAQHMAYFAWLIGSCQDVEITITAKYES